MPSNFGADECLVCYAMHMLVFLAIAVTHVTRRCKQSQGELCGCGRCGCPCNHVLAVIHFHANEAGTLAAWHEVVQDGHQASRLWHLACQQRHCSLPPPPCQPVYAFKRGCWALHAERVLPLHTHLCRTQQVAKLVNHKTVIAIVHGVQGESPSQDECHLHSAACLVHSSIAISRKFLTANCQGEALCRQHLASLRHWTCNRTTSWLRCLCIHAAQRSV